MEKEKKKKKEVESRILFLEVRCSGLFVCWFLRHAAVFLALDCRVDEIKKRKRNEKEMSCVGREESLSHLHTLRRWSLCSLELLLLLVLLEELAEAVQHAQVAREVGKLVYIYIPVVISAIYD
jgi:hypothetical protein